MARPIQQAQFDVNLECCFLHVLKSCSVCNFRRIYSRCKYKCSLPKSCVEIECLHNVVEARQPANMFRGLQEDNDQIAWWPISRNFSLNSGSKVTFESVPSAVP